MSKYYEAYDKRYKQVHNKGLSWSTNINTKIVETIINKYKLENEKMLEIGCGEGRDAKYLLNKNYNLLATDISQEAIKYCQNNDDIHKICYKVFDVINDDSLGEKFGFVYSVACLHMFVLDHDRNCFYKFIYNHLSNNGYSLILTMGDGINESSSDIDKAFDDITRIHQETNQKLHIATTSCRIVDFNTLKGEVIQNGFDIVESGLTNIENHFDKIMYILIKKN